MLARSLARRGVFIGIFGLLMFSFYKVSNAPPGYITTANHHKYNRYPYDLQVRARARARACAVSYTHLTLPTNREV